MRTSAPPTKTILVINIILSIMLFFFGVALALVPKLLGFTVEKMIGYIVAIYGIIRASHYVSLYLRFFGRSGM